MTTLDCNVKECTHNEDNCCCLSNIEVKGSCADKCDDTCCGSYAKKEANAASNSTQSPKFNLSIMCQATDCVYNEEKKCSANHVDISGMHAMTEDETICSTFSKK